MLISYEHMAVLGYPRDTRADGYLDISRAQSTPDIFHGAEASEEGEVSDSDESDAAPETTTETEPQVACTGAKIIVAFLCAEANNYVFVVVAVPSTIQ